MILAVMPREQLYLDWQCPELRAALHEQLRRHTITLGVLRKIHLHFKDCPFDELRGLTRKELRDRSNFGTLSYKALLAALTTIGIELPKDPPWNKGLRRTA